MNTAKLESMLANRQSDDMKALFGAMVRRDVHKAAKLINDAEVTFPTFFVLLDIVRHNIPENELSERNKRAIHIYNECMLADGFAYNRTNDEKVLLWMTTHCKDKDGMSDSYDRIIDYCLGRLVCDYHNGKSLENAVELIFIRNEKDEFYHDLVWEVFRSDSADVIKLISKHANGKTEKEKEFSEELLANLIDDDPEDNNEISSHMNDWMNENEPYIEFKGNSFNSSSSPEFCKVNYLSKYSGCPCTHCGFYLPMSGRDMKDEEHFRCLDCRTQALLAHKSCMLRKRNMAAWCRWKSHNAYLDLTDPLDIWEV